MEADAAGPIEETTPLAISSRNAEQRDIAAELWIDAVTHSHRFRFHRKEGRSSLSILRQWPESLND